MRKWLNRWIIKRALNQFSENKVVYNSTLHTHFREDGIKTKGRFNIMLCVLLEIQSKYDRYLGIKNIGIDEDESCIKIYIELNKVSRLITFRSEMEDELEKVFGKKVSIQMKYVNKLYGLDFYDVI